MNGTPVMSLRTTRAGYFFYGGIFIKKFINYGDMIETLKKKGFIISDENEVHKILQRVTFYKFNQYCDYFKKALKNQAVSIENVYTLYLFDKEMRSLFLNHIGDIEVELKSKIAYYIGDLISNDFEYLKYDNKELYEDFDKIKILSERIVKKCTQEESLKLKKYYGESHKKEDGIPVWIAFESLTFGEVIEFLTSLKEKHKHEIMKQLGYRNYKIFHENLESLRIVRNVCAHYNRFWNNKFFSPRKKIKGYKELWNYLDTKTMVSYIYGVFSIMLPEDEFNSFNIRLSKIVENYKVDIREMGFFEEIIFLDK